MLSFLIFHHTHPPLVMGLGLIVFHGPYRDNEFTYRQRNQADYYYVEHGFFRIQNSLGNLLFTLLHLMAIPAFYVLIAHRQSELLFVGKALSSLSSLPPPLPLAPLPFPLALSLQSLLPPLISAIPLDLH